MNTLTPTLPSLSPITDSGDFLIQTAAGQSRPVTPIDLTIHYIRTLRTWADPADLQRLLAGAAEPSDILDHNEALAEAWFNTTGTEMVFDPADTGLLQMLEAAMALAKRAGYRTSVALALHLYDAGHRLDKTTKKLADPTKRLVAEEIATTYNVGPWIARPAIHMVHVWSLGILPVGTADKI